jgi:IMP dehydrogenase
MDEERKEEVLNALTVGQRPVRHEMTDVDDVIFLSTTASPEENLDRVGGSPHTRFPLVGEDPADFRGIVYVPAIVDMIDDLRAGRVTFADIAAPPTTVDVETPLSEAVDQFQRENQELALVLEDGEVVGLLTATDALEAVMGEIEDPLDVDTDAIVSSG